MRGKSAYTVLPTDATLQHHSVLAEEGATETLRKFSDFASRGSRPVAVNDTRKRKEASVGVREDGPRIM